MDQIRKDRMLHQLQTRLRDAALATREITDDTWNEITGMRLEEILLAMQKMSATSPEFGRWKEAVALLYPHRPAWLIISRYRREILEAEDEEQKDLLESVLNVLTDNSRAGRGEIEKNVYAFWPVMEQAFISQPEK